MASPTCPLRKKAQQAPPRRQDWSGEGGTAQLSSRLSLKGSDRQHVTRLQRGSKKGREEQIRTGMRGKQRRERERCRRQGRPESSAGLKWRGGEIPALRP